MRVTLTAIGLCRFVQHLPNGNEAFCALLKRIKWPARHKRDTRRLSVLVETRCVSLDNACFANFEGNRLTRIVRDLDDVAVLNVFEESEMGIPVSGNDGEPVLARLRAVHQTGAKGHGLPADTVQDNA